MMTDPVTTLSVTVDARDQATTQEMVASLTPYQQGKVEQTRDFGATLAIAASAVELAKGLVELWLIFKKARDKASAKTKPPTAVRIEAKDGSVLSLAEVHDEEEILRFVRNHSN